MKKSFLLVAPLLAFLVQVPGQNGLSPANPEQQFERMRELAAAGNYSEAKKIGYDLIGENEEYFDAALYLVRIHGWQSSFDSAYQILDGLIEQNPDLYEAYKTCTDLAYWENNLERFELCAAKALELESDSSAVFDKFRVALQQNRPETEQLEVFGFYSYDHFTQPYVRNWHMITSGAKIPVKQSTLIPSLNGGYHPGNFAQNLDFQINLDAYLKLGAKNYALLGYGFSPRGKTDFFPVHRGAAELWQVLPAGFTISAGLRYFYWDQHFSFLTLSGEKYYANYLFTLRTYLFKKDYGVSGSYYLSARRYFDSRYTHLTLTLGYGTAPDEPLLVVSDLDRLSSISGRLGFSKQLSPRVRLFSMIGYAWEEYAANSYRHRLDLKAGAYFMIVR